MDKIDFIPIENLRGLHFIVKDYQRGYKWDSKQMEELIKDIHNHKEDQGKYCLQPIIIRTETEGLELIDGQQRLTSIYLLHHYLNNEIPYSIDYQTRSGTQKFLKDHLDHLKEQIEQGLDWDRFLEVNSDHEFDNVDIYHLFHVYHAIHLWFTNNHDDLFLRKLKTQVSVIWYDIKEDTIGQEAEDVFLNLNAGKIPLTNSELIKALFVLSIQQTSTEEIARLKAFEFANEWDQIENKLQDDNFWFFIADHPYYSTIDTRIDLIIDLVNGIAPPSKNWLDWDNMKAYRVYESSYLNGEDLNWNTIKQTYNKLVEWYEDKELYHLVGYLINARIFMLKDIINLSKKKDKNQFVASLVDRIKSEFNKTNKSGHKPYDLDQVNYKDNRKESQNLLLLLNVQNFLQDISSNRFPFDLYVKESWSVEHINPQNPREFKTTRALIVWFNSFLQYLSKHKEHMELESKIKSFIQFLQTQTDLNKKLSENRIGKERNTELDEIVDSLTELMNLHGIENLALLDRNTNSKIGNKVFIDKRNIIIDLFQNAKREKVFIPISTKDIFTKTYSKDRASVTDELFGPSDMEAYKNHIENQLNKYFH